VPTNSLSNVTACSWKAGRLDIFSVDEADNLWQETFNDGAWSAWQLITGPVIKEVSGEGSKSQVC
jgi:hypothetical protein